MKMLKVGDKLLCKKSYKLVNNFYKCKKERNKYYTITCIDVERIYFEEDFFFNISQSIWYIWDYFYTPQELRKLKLERLKHVEGR